MDVALALQSAGSGSEALLQYGAVGLLALLAIGACRVLWTQYVTSIRNELERERQRADRLETELARLNAMVQTQTMQALNEATRAVSDAMVRLRGGDAS